MPVRCFAVIDTNVLVSTVSKQKSVPDSIVKLAFDESITPVLNGDIEAEYRGVLLRPKLHLTEDVVNDVIDIFHQRGLYVDSEAIDVDLPGPKDRVFYEVVMEERRDGDIYLVTGNIHHFPTAPFIATPKQMLDIILEDQKG